jgi:hypothetical protein
MEALQMKKWNYHSASREIGASQTSKQRDEAQLARLGKREVLKVSPTIFVHTAKRSHLLIPPLGIKQRNFGSMAVLGFSTSILVTWEAELMYVSCSRRISVPS